MSVENINKIKVSALTFGRLERLEADLTEFIQGRGAGSIRGARQALLSLQAILPELEIEKFFSSPTWDGSGAQ